MSSEHPLLPAVMEALGRVQDPEIHRPITELGMVESVAITDDNLVELTVLLTIAGCPLRNTIERDVTAALNQVDGVDGVRLTLGTMTDAQREAMKQQLRGGTAQREIPFATEDSLTQVILVASGKGGVGKSSLTVNLGMALKQRGRSVGILDADIYGHSIPQMMGLVDARPTSVDEMIMPVPSLGLKVMSMGMLKETRDQVIAWRGPILDRALHQLLSDVYWGDLDFLLLDLPPGTGDVALSLGQKLPNAEVLVVTTPQQAAAEVAERAGTMASMMNQRVLGVVENMAYLDTTCPHCGTAHRVDVFGSGGGQTVATTLTKRLGYEVPLLAEIPLDPSLRESGDEGVPLVELDVTKPSAVALQALAERLAARKRSLAGRHLGLTPVS